jgi:G:T-mismatch repair DNA endonuclease (very short patch repair protein)
MNLEIFYNKNGVLNRNKLKENWIKTNMFELHNSISNFIIPDEIVLFSQKMYHYFNNLNNFHECEWCGNKNKRWKSFDTGYKKGCSRSCAIQLSRPTSNITRKNNTIEKYGVDHTSKLSIVKDKMKKTNMEKYGGVSPSNSEIILNKIKKTNMEKYGVEFPLQNEDIKSKMIANFINKWGVDNPIKSPLIKNKIRLFNLEKYGVEWQIISNSTIKKTKKTNLRKYGHEHNWSNNEVIKKGIETKFEKYGRNGISDRIKNTKLLKTKLDLNRKYSNLEIKSVSMNRICEIFCEKHNGYYNINTNLLFQRDIHNYEICTVCNKIGNNNKSSYESEIIIFLKSYKIRYIHSYREFGKEIDIYLQDYKIGIEFNGIYWHSELFREKNYHRDKTDFFLEKGIDIIHIWEDDWLYKNDIVKSIILNKLGLCKRLVARKCYIKEISNSESIEFLNKNHLQGHTASKINIGLFSENELFSIMSFSDKRYIKNEAWEIVRLCSKIGYHIQGGASKLFKYFLEKYNPNVVISYSKRDYSNIDNNVYLKLGFCLDRIIEPGYSWCKKYKRYNRYNFRKDKLVSEGYDEKKTESQIMYERGYYKSWDSGNFKFIFKRI